MTLCRLRKIFCQQPPPPLCSEFGFLFLPDWIIWMFSMNLCCLCTSTIRVIVVYAPIERSNSMNGPRTLLKEQHVTQRQETGKRQREDRQKIDRRQTEDRKLKRNSTSYYIKYISTKDSFWRFSGGHFDQLRILSNHINVSDWNTTSSKIMSQSLTPSCWRGLSSEFNGTFRPEYCRHKLITEKAQLLLGKEMLSRLRTMNYFLWFHKGNNSKNAINLNETQLNKLHIKSNR